jgi:hypothetical protein
MTGTRYRIFETEYPHFLTCTIVGWLPVFTRPETVGSVLECWRFLQEKRDFRAGGTTLTMEAKGVRAKNEVYIARKLHDRKLQRALLHFFKPENYFEVREALIQAGRADLIGGGCEALIPAQPPKEALTARSQKANQAARGDYVHTIPKPARLKGYRPARKTARRRDRR